MKNILFITSSRDDSGVGIQFIDDTSNIADPNHKNMIEDVLLGIDQTECHTCPYWAHENSGLCGSEQWGYITIGVQPTYPITVEHIVNYCL